MYVYSLALDRLDNCCPEMTEGVGSDHHGITSVDYSRLHDTGNNSSHERDRERVIDQEFEGRLRIVVTMVWENVQESPD
jgi:hypothetical protein